MRLVTYPDLSRIFGIGYSRRQLARLETEGKFPRRLKLGDAAQSRIGWDGAEIEAWLDQAKRRTEAKREEKSCSRPLGALPGSVAERDQ